MTFHWDWVDNLNVTHIKTDKGGSLRAKSINQTAKWRTDDYHLITINTISSQKVIFALACEKKTSICSIFIAISRIASGVYLQLGGKNWRYK